ncbi:hypothetical protein C2G38_2044081 [Gigaspora rosea]|uniref:Uncharacterized protein n=1 Tax=Gigaspora rosea TaxID=44941 RepID=A0A397URC2_9GLOM|nr:hypothetical protein C2G38_2044081 [Gigaspora rosea]
MQTHIRQPWGKGLWKDVLKRIANPNRQVPSIVLTPRVILKQELPTRTTEPFSTVITEEHAAEIATGMAISEHIQQQISLNYFFVEPEMGLLINRFGDKQANTIVVMKVNNIDKIIADYNPVKWTSCRKATICKIGY